ncbi:MULTISPECIES: hypothetical protein [Bacillus subtilis group]|uniref:hypothetical protein n=1 Tax=Bacillus subtilis group TaxID=653685 RepID=UPI0009B792E5|nr:MULTISPECIES: hypothetical protein [Bacillus subtilis group]ARC74984.1 hypothetical protein B37_02959 [Bacillus licheniformis]ARW44133.1 hypothetical protein S100141_02838 [Bacillus licheniformis]ARW55493.1 hypothetical protein S100027_03524 [Bacillus licheniformis]AXF90061.1 short-chain dehydrogenase [Bacillus licheniformis]MBU5327543.1 hypothetical protein [Bacillus paralicheniformis]
MCNEITSDYLALQLGLYQPFIINEENADQFEAYMRDPKKIQFDSYCIECKKESTFKFHSQRGVLPAPPPAYVLTNFLDRIKSDDPITLLFQCQRNGGHLFYLTLLIRGNKVTKIGQYPSLADLQLHKIDRYRKILKDDYRDFSKAIRLYSQEIGAGSFVYLRRIFENLIEEARQTAASQESQWDDSIFYRSKMDEKIKLLKNYLPEFLVQNRQLYAILSKGIHELNEKECLDLFPNVQLAIEIILDEKIHQKEKQKKISSAQNFVSASIERLKS